MRYVFWVLFFLFPYDGESQPTSVPLADGRPDYLPYHRAVAEADSLLSEQAFKEALTTYQALFKAYPSSFLREYKIATQLGFHLGETNLAYALLTKGIRHGWTMRDLKKTSFYQLIRHQPAWKQTESQYVALNEEHTKTLRSDIQKQVSQMFQKDQRMALKALFHFTSKGQDKYAERKFAPHSETQLRRLKKIIETHGYPGEKLIGNTYWAAVMLSHHNSISVAYVQRDTLYPQMRPLLLKAVKMGQLSPQEFAQMDDWHVVIKSNHQDKGYGYIGDVQTDAEHKRADSLRAQVALSSIEVVKKMRDVQKQTGLNFYLP